MLALQDLRGIVVLDEIQRRPEFFPVLRVLADRRDVTAAFLLLGSAAPDLLRQSIVRPTMSQPDRAGNPATNHETMLYYIRVPAILLYLGGLAMNKARRQNDSVKTGSAENEMSRMYGLAYLSEQSENQSPHGATRL
jgi:hypothetical protein